MTCSSLMKWPRGLGEFRCIICDTINDLAPLETRDGSDPHSGMFPKFGTPDSTGTMWPLLTVVL